MRLGLLGGTFDPIHRGHLDAGRVARRALGLDRVLLVPARVPPHRAAEPHASGYHRFAMAVLAAQDAEGFEVSDIELASPGPSYTARTLREFQRFGLAASQMFFISGVDAFADIATWHDYPELLDLAHWVVVARPGYAIVDLAARLPEVVGRFERREADAVPPASTADRTSVWLVEATTTDVSSTELRRRIRANEPFDDLAPLAVTRHIRHHGLYQAPSPAGRLHDQE